MPATALIPIPAATHPQPCKSCGKRLYWVRHPSTGKWHPVSIAHEQATEPTIVTAGRGISHFADCEQAAQHRRAR